jgi:hypothetical protein
MMELDGNADSVLMNRVNKTPKAGDELILINTKFSRMGLAASGYRCYLDDYQRHAPFRPFLVVATQALRDRAVLVSEQRAHRSHYDAVAQLHSPDATGLKQPRQKVHVTPPFSKSIDAFVLSRHIALTGPRALKESQLEVAAPTLPA